MEHLRDMGLFVDLVNAMSFTRAAEALGIPKSSLSRRISELEQALGVRLLNRTTRRLELTEAGALYYSRAREIIEAARVAHEQLKGVAEEPRGHLRISMLADFGTIVLAPLMAEFARDYPDITFDIDLSPRRVDLVSEHFDVAIRFGESPDSTLTARRLGTLSARLYASPAYIEQHGMPAHPLDLSRHECLRIPMGPQGSRWTLTRSDGKAEEKVEVGVQGRFAMNNMGMLRRLTCEGMGIGPIDETQAKNDLKIGRLVQVLPDWQRQPIPIYAFTATRLLPAKTRAFVDFLARHMRRGVDGADPLQE